MIGVERSSLRAAVDAVVRSRLAGPTAYRRAWEPTEHESLGEWIPRAALHANRHVRDCCCPACGGPRNGGNQ